MSCEKWEPLIALWAGWDLSDDEARTVSAHLQSCSRCRALGKALRDNQAVLRDLREEDLAVMAAGVRVDVLARVGQPARARWWRFAWVAAAALVIVLWRWPAGTPGSGQANRLPHPPFQHPVQQQNLLLEGMRDQTLPQQVVQQRPLPPRPVRRHRGRRPAAAEPLVVKMLTDDPDVVIYWIVEQKGD